MRVHTAVLVDVQTHLGAQSPATSNSMHMYASRFDTYLTVQNCTTQCHKTSFFCNLLFKIDPQYKHCSKSATFPLQRLIYVFCCVEAEKSQLN